MPKLVAGKFQTMKWVWTGSEKAEYKDKGITKRKRAKQCINCISNKEGYCNRYSEWCDKSRVQCTECIEKTSDYDINGRFVKSSRRNKNNKRRRNNNKKKT